MTVRASLHRRRGITLVELLVAITLIALLTIGLYQAFGIGTRAASTVSTNIDRPAQIALAYDFMQRAFTGAAPLPAGHGSIAGRDKLRRRKPNAEPSLCRRPISPIGGFQRLHLGL